MIVRIMDSKTNPCRHCGGSLGLGNDEFGSYIQCLMCGRETELKQTAGMNLRLTNPVLNEQQPLTA